MVSETESFENGRRLQHSGDYPRAEQVFRQLLAENPDESKIDEAEIWYRLGEVCHAQQKLTDAASAYENALRLQPDQSHWYANWGVALSDLGRFDAAISVFQQALRLRPDSFEVHYNLANAFHKLGRLDQAIANYRQALDLQPDHADTFTNLGVALAEHGRFEEATENLRQAIRLQPNSAKAHHNLGVALLEQSRWDEAIGCLNQALECRPDYPEAHYNLGTALVEIDRRPEGILQFREALRLRPNHSGALNNLGLALKDEGQLEEAVVVLKQAARIAPDRVDAHNNLGLALAELGRFDEAIDSYERALRIDPGFSDAHTNIGSAYKEQGRLDAAVACYQLSLWLNPDGISTHWNRSLAWLQAGELQKGWEEYEWRWRRKRMSPREFRQPMWDGSPLEGRTILLHMEQGLGDMLQFIRYAAELKRTDCRVVVECPGMLIPLFSTCPGIDQLIPEGNELPSFDVYAPLLSLPRLLGTTLENIPCDVPYLRADPDRATKWGQELQGTDGFKIGICWQGNPHHQWDRHRSIPLREFAALAHVAGVHLYSLQRDHGLDQLQSPRLHFEIHQHCDNLDAEGGAFLDTAAIMSHLDLVVTADTSIAHLAGALGVPVWVALSTIADWRWMLDRTDSPWYPTMRLFRQKSLGHWRQVFRQMARAVGKLRTTREAAETTDRDDKT